MVEYYTYYGSNTSKAYFLSYHSSRKHEGVWLVR